MENPLHRLKRLPWSVLFQIATLTIAISMLLEFLIILGSKEIPAVGQTLTMLRLPPFKLLLPVVGGLGIGALAVSILEQFFAEIVVNTALLWALVFSLFALLMAKYYLGFVFPIPVLLIDLDQTVVLGMLMGVFWKGRPYWHS
ncbi:hypothetical protein BST81_17420 [Leptolyngbya sp. 'hensonii']|uniref:hypothetical protein n=1 Tax=Leptolyngbya sp. 'hensonii' TaxID=1922337 RepID=UPI0009502C06|nr:hypothetical protein [Leptolyngbya sp. 'hensonii']OLP17131.1 hypothetical protein BST81_17420 [Leptolyngbya sp. 'hensonii']